MIGPISMDLPDWRVVDGTLEDAPEHHWPVVVTQHATAYGGISAIVQRGAEVAGKAARTEVYIEREGNALRVSIYQYTADGDVDEEPRFGLSIAPDGTITTRT